MKLMASNCGEDDIEDFTWIFDQQAANPMPRDGSSCPDFVYRPNPSSFDSWGAPRRLALMVSASATSTTRTPTEPGASTSSTPTRRAVAT